MHDDHLISVCARRVRHGRSRTRRRIYLLLPGNVAFAHLSRGDAHASLSVQLIPGHEVVGVIADIGKDVTDFAKGDRCVADPGVTVSELSIYSGPLSLKPMASAVLASTADGANHCCARTSKGRG